jgi:calcineurin-like phosphoesterase family protein
MAVFFTSDTHFGHLSVIGNCQRPFASVEEMDEALIARWNAAVFPGDTVYHLGDFACCPLREVPAYIGRLNGEIHLIAGNHDTQMLRKHAGHFASVSVMQDVTLGGQMLVLCHYPMREWNWAYGGAWHLHGHVHGRLNHDPVGHSMDVGVDSHEDYRPWSFEEVAEIMSVRVSPFAAERRAPVRKTIRVPSPPGNPGTR